MAQRQVTHSISLEHFSVVDELHDCGLQMFHDVGHAVVHQARFAREVAVPLQREGVDEAVADCHALRIKGYS